MVDRAAVFERYRPRLRGIAYRMLGSVGDAEDIVQEAYLRWHGADPAAVRSAEAWLVTAVTRLSIDRLRAAAVEREAYIGPWLPEPWVGGDGDADPGEPVAPAEAAPDRRLDRAADLSMAFLVLLERLAPEERAAFLLRDVFDVDYADIARTLDKSEAACRQLVHRARERVRDGGHRPRFEVTEAARRRLLQQFLDAARAGDRAALLALFAPDATLTSDGGGKVWAARNVIRGADRLARLVLGLARKAADRAAVDEITVINGEPAIVTWVNGRPSAVTFFDTDGRRIRAIYRVLNPDKLRGLGGVRPITGQT